MYSPNIIRHKELDEIISFRFRPGRRRASRRPWACPSGPAAMPSGRASFPGKLLFLRGRSPGGPDDWRYWHSAARISSPQQAPGGAVAAPPVRLMLSARLSSCRWFAWPPPMGRASGHAAMLSRWANFLWKAFGSGREDRSALLYG